MQESVGTDTPLPSVGVPVWASPRSQKELNTLADLTIDGYGQRFPAYNTYRNYYDGEQNTLLTDRASQYLEASGMRFAENVCDTIVDVMSERLVVEGFTTDEKEDDAPVAEYVMNAWQQNRMDEHASTVESEKTKLGDYFVMIDWDANKNQPRILPNKPDNIAVRYSQDDPSRIEIAVKKWETHHGSRRMNVYLDDRIEKYWQPAEVSDAWMPHVDEGDEYWPVPWTRDNLPPYAAVPVTTEDGVEVIPGAPGGEGEARGIPVVHFRNKANGSCYGRSELRKVIPQQDALNKHILDLNDVMDYQGWPQRYITGLDPDEVGTIKNTPGTIMAVSDPDAKIGAFPQADLEKFIRAIESDLQRIAALTRTPLRFLNVAAGTPSGESIKAGDAGLVSKVKQRSVADGNGWSDVMVMAVRLAEDYQVLQRGDVEPRIKTQWADPETRNEESDWKVALMQQQVGVSTATILQERGYDASDEAEKRDAEASVTDDAALRALNRGVMLESEAISGDDAEA